MISVSLQRNSEIPIKRQLYQALKEQILAGRLKAGEVLPSTRELAQQANVSRNTVCEAYDMLITEGFVLNRQGAPTRVAEGLHVENIPQPAPSTRENSDIHYLADFKTGRPDLRYFPQYLWQQVLNKSARELPLSQLSYSGPQGMPELRREISAWLFRSKGLDVDYRDIYITSGATQALHIIAGLLPGNKVAIEDPCNMGIFHTFLNAGCELHPIPVDEKGIQTDDLDTINADMIYVTPSHQFPLGCILNAGRRAALIRYAREKGIYIIEDDYDSEFRYTGEPVAPLYSMDPQRVLYVGTFSKVLFPAIRIGYVIVPRQLQRRWCELRTYTDVQSAPFEQAALAQLMKTRKFDRHVRSMRKLYGERRIILLSALKESFGDCWRVWGDCAGLHIVIEFPQRCFNDEFIEKCRQRGIRIASVEHHSIIKGCHLNKLLLGYGHLEPDEIQKGICNLRAVIDSISK